MWTRINKALIFGIFVLGGLGLPAQSVLEGYLREGIQENLVLQEKKIGLERGMLGLQQARRLFLPSVNFAGTYTLAKGGRTIDFPVGDMLNPVYSTLNMLTQSNSFPQLENQQIQFLPNNFYDARVRTTMPLINSDVIHNQHIQEGAARMREEELAAYRLELVREIRVAYYRYLMAGEALNIYASGMELAQRAVSVNQSLLENGKGLPAQVMRAETEVEMLRSQEVQAKKDVANAQAYFNFLLNRDPDARVERDSLLLPGDFVSRLSGETSPENRPEIFQLDHALGMNQEALKLRQQYWTPRLSTFLDLGSQAFDFEVSTQSLYAMWGLQLDIPLWNGGRDQTAISLQRQTGMELENKREQAMKGIELATRIARNETLAAYDSWKSSLKVVETAETYYRLAEKAYLQGVMTFIELVDARNQLTQAKILANIRKYETFIHWAEFSRESAEPFE